MKTPKTEQWQLIVGGLLALTILWLVFVAIWEGI